jgi:hypothetical protein
VDSHPILISLVGGRPLPNVLINLNIEAAARYFVVSRDSAAPGGQLDDTAAALPVDRRPSRNVTVDPYDLTKTHDACLELAALHPGTSTLLNVSCGSKPMAFGAYQAARELQAAGRVCDVCYLAGRDLLWIFEPGRRLTLQLGLEEYFSAYGWKVHLHRQRRFPSWTDFATRLAARDPEILRFVQLLLASKNPAKDGAEHPALTGPLLDQLVSAGLITPLRSLNGAPRYRLTDADARKFLDGGWLEDHVYDITEQTAGPGGTPLFDEVGLAVEDIAGKGECDVAALRGGQLVLLETKSGKLKSEHFRVLAEKATRLGGKMCSTVMVCGDSLSDLAPEDLANRQRWGNTHQVVFVSAEDVPRLGEILLKVACQSPGLEPADVPIYQRF